MEIKFNKDIQDIKGRIFFNLTVRQFIWLAAGAVVCISVILSDVKAGLLYNKANISWLSWKYVFLAAPFILVGFFSWNGLPIEQYLKILIRNIKVPRNLKYKPISLYEVEFMEKMTKLQESEIKKDIINSKLKKKKQREMKRKRVPNWDAEKMEVEEDVWNEEGIN